MDVLPIGTADYDLETKRGSRRLFLAVRMYPTDPAIVMNAAVDDPASF
jgi:hypothetical protein